jgi:hypothetical protein
MGLGPVAVRFKNLPNGVAPLMPKHLKPRHQTSDRQCTGTTLFNGHKSANGGSVLAAELSFMVAPSIALGKVSLTSDRSVGTVGRYLLPALRASAFKK